MATGNPIWAFGGAVWAMSLVLLSARHDARYKAFVQRLKRVRGKLEVRGGGGGRPEPQPPIPAAGSAARVAGSQVDGDARCDERGDLRCASWNHRRGRFSVGRTCVCRRPCCWRFYRSMDDRPIAGQRGGRGGVLRLVLSLAERVSFFGAGGGWLRTAIQRSRLIRAIARPTVVLTRQLQMTYRVGVCQGSHRGPQGGKSRGCVSPAA